MFLNKATKRLDPLIKQCITEIIKNYNFVRDQNSIKKIKYEESKGDYQENYLISGKTIDVFASLLNLIKIFK